METTINRDANFETWVLLAQTRRALFRARRKYMDPHVVSNRQASLVFTVSALGKNATLAEIARFLFRGPNTVSELVKRSIATRLVSKNSVDNNKKSVFIELTEHGQSIYNASRNEQIVTRMMSELSGREHYKLRGLLEKLWYHALEQLDMECLPPLPLSIKPELANDRNWITWITFAQTRRAMFRARSLGLEPFGITPRQAAMLFMILTLGNTATPSKLARCLFLEPNSVSELVDRMQKAGFINKRNNLDRRNSVRTELTTKGLDIYRSSVSEEPVHKVMAAFSDSEHQELRNILRKLWDMALKELGMAKREPFAGT